MMHPTPLTATRLPFGQHQGKTFDDLWDAGELGYLDWLAGQSWLYGSFKHRLNLFLTHPIIQRELDDLFPEEWDDSREPLFSITDLPHGCLESAPEGLKGANHSNPHRLPMPEEDREPRDWYPTKMKPLTAWQIAADMLLDLEAITDVNDFLDLDFEPLKQALTLLTKQVHTKLQEAYRTMRERLRTTKTEPVGNAYTFHFLVKTTKDGKLSRKGRQLKWMYELLAS